jgi:hypothetical protein
VRKQPGIFVQDPVCKLLRQRWAKRLQRNLTRDAAIPARQDKRWEVGIVVKVVVREYHRIDVSWSDTVPHQLPRCRGAAIEQQFLAANVDYVRRPEALWHWVRGAASNDCHLWRS